MVQKGHRLKFDQPMALLPCHRGGRPKEFKERTCVPIPIILSEIALLFFTTLDCKFHQKFKND